MDDVSCFQTNKREGRGRMIQESSFFTDRYSEWKQSVPISFEVAVTPGRIGREGRAVGAMDRKERTPFDSHGNCILPRLDATSEFRSSSPKSEYPTQETPLNRLLDWALFAGTDALEAAHLAGIDFSASDVSGQRMSR